MRPNLTSLFATLSAALVSLTLTREAAGTKVSALFSTHPPTEDRIKTTQQDNCNLPSGTNAGRSRNLAGGVSEH